MRAHPTGVDALLAISCITLTVLPGTNGAFATLEQELMQLAGAVAGGVLLMFRRRRPLLVAVLCALISAIPGQAFVSFAAIAGAYALGVYAPSRHQVWAGIGAISIIGAFVALPASVALFADADVLGASIFLGFCASVYAIPALIGISVGTQRRYVAEIAARAFALERERDQRARLAVADERTRIAREMHDVVSHGLTVMVALSEGAAATAASSPHTPPPTAAAMRLVADTGRTALAEMRRLLHVLRGPDHESELTPQPTDADLDALIHQFQVAGLPVLFHRHGALPPSTTLQLTLYRIVQEGLTNVLRHAPHTQDVEVRIDYAPSSVTILVTNGPSHPQSTSHSSPGTGLRGIRERAELFAGTVRSGPTPDHGWQLIVHLHEITEQ